MGGNIYTAIPAIMAEIGPIGKDRTNVSQKYKYRGIEDFYNACQPLMLKYKVFSVPRVIEQQREERTSQSGGHLMYSILTIEYTFYAEDGSSVVATVVGEGMDSGDKASNKAMSVAHKYALAQIFAVPTADMVDPETESPEPAPRGITGKPVGSLGDRLTTVVASPYLKEEERAQIRSEYRATCTTDKKRDAYLSIWEGKIKERQEAEKKGAEDAFLSAV